MTNPNRTSRRSGPRARRRYGGLALAAVALAALAATVAMAASATRVIGAASNSSVNATVVVDTHGRTLYALRPETAHHLLCKSKACFEFWPPLTVHSANVKLAGSGVEGRLGVIRRGAGKWQVTLRGMPLYRFAGDSAKGQANGEGIKTFGGTWHTIGAGTKAAAPQMNQPTTSTPSPVPGY